VPLRRRGRTFTGSGPLKWVKHAYEARFENACSVRGDQAAKPAVARAVAARGSTFRVVRARLGKTPEVVVNTGAPALKVHYDCPPGGRDRNQWEWPWHGLAFAAVRLNEWPPRFENDRG
jgi:hypothetical protein